MKALKFLLMAGCVLGLELGSALGQGESATCGQCVCVADDECYASETSCSSTITIDCRSTTFVAARSGWYHLRAVMACSNGDYACKYCYACVRIYSGTTEIGSCHNTCVADECTYECTNAVTLTQGNSYAMYVCLRKCAGGDCEGCQCTARGYLSQDWSDCNTIPVCNP